MTLAASGAMPREITSVRQAPALPLDAIEVVARRVVLAGRRRLGRRRHARHRDALARPLDEAQRTDVIVAVDDELGAVPRQRVAQRRAIDQPLEMS